MRRRRMKLGKRHSKRLFAKHSRHVRRHSLKRRIMRGGIRL